MENRKILLVLIILLIEYASFSQSTTALNFNGGVQYLGYFNNAGPLWFRNNSPTLNENRMLIMNGAFGNNDGQIAIGNNLPNNFAPSARFHLHQTGGLVFTRYTTDNIRATNQDGFMTGINNNGQSFLVNFEDDQPMSFMTENLPNPSPFERMRINANNLY
jgi:hypothetical protein